MAGCRMPQAERGEATGRRESARGRPSAERRRNRGDRISDGLTPGDRISDDWTRGDGIRYAIRGNRISEDWVTGLGMTGPAVPRRRPDQQQPPEGWLDQ